MVRGGRKWANLTEEACADVYEILGLLGATSANGLSQHERWRVVVRGVTVAAYRNGTIYMPPKPGADSMLVSAAIEELVSTPFVGTDRTFLVGFDESGKSEIAGATVVAGVVVPNQVAHEVEHLLGTSETKTHKQPGYFDRLYEGMIPLLDRGVRMAVRRIQPDLIDSYNVTGLLDVTYAELARELIEGLPVDTVRLAADDYGIRGPFKRFLDDAKRQGGEVFIATKADDRFIEVRAASIFARHERERVVEEMNADERWQINGLGIGAGHWGQPDTLAWVTAWKDTRADWPPFIRRSAKPIRNLDGLTRVTKPYPPGHAL